MVRTLQRCVNKSLFLSKEDARIGIGFLFMGLLLGLALRLGMLWLVNFRFDLGDSAFYLNAAHNLLDYHIYSESENIPLVSSFTRPPLYSFFIASVMGILGKKVLFIQLVQMLLSIFTGLLATRIAAYFVPRAAPWVFGLMMLSPFEAVYSATVLSESLTAFLLVAASCAILTLEGAKRWLVGGVLLGICTLTRDIYWPLVVPISFLWIFLGKGQIRSRCLDIAILVLSFCLVVLPWTLRNYHVSGRFVPVSEGRLGGSLWVGTWATNGEFTKAYLSGPHVYPPEAFRSPSEKLLVEKAESQTSDAIAADRVFRSLAIQRIHDEPFSVLRRYIVREPLLWFGTRFEIFQLNSNWLPRGSHPWRAVKSMLWGLNSLFLVAGLAGIVLSWRKRDKLLILVLPVAYTALVYFPFNSYENRYSQPVYPFLLVFAAIAAAGLANALLGSRTGDHAEERRK